MVEVGKCYYFMVHAYHHFLGEVVEITGKRECTIKRCVRVQSSELGWTEFFAAGCSTDNSVLTFWPDGLSITYFAVSPWHHPIPEGAPCGPATQEMIQSPSWRTRSRTTEERRRRSGRIARRPLTSLEL